MESLLPRKICPEPMALFIFCGILLDGINSILTKCADPTALISGSSGGKLYGKAAFNQEKIPMKMRVDYYKIRYYDLKMLTNLNRNRYSISNFLIDL